MAEAGPAGAQGEAGARGPIGFDGLRGPRGDAGEDGVRDTDPIRVATLAVLAIVALVVTALVWFLLTYVSEQRRLAECQRAAFAETNSALVTSVAAAGRDRRELRQLVTTLTDPAKTREERAAALDDYLRTLDAGEAARARNPLLGRTC